MLGKESWLVHEERLSSIEAENDKLRKDLYECIRMVKDSKYQIQVLRDIIRKELQPKILVGAPMTRDNTNFNEYAMSQQEIEWRRQYYHNYPIPGTTSDIKTGITSQTHELNNIVDIK